MQQPILKNRNLRASIHIHETTFVKTFNTPCTEHIHNYPYTHLIIYKYWKNNKC